MLTQIVPDIHFSTQRPHLNDCLTQEVIRFPLEALFYPRLDVIIFIPHPNLNSIGGVMTLTGRGGNWEER